MTEPVGTLLWEMRAAAGFSLGELARRAGLSKATLSQWESGKRQPRVAELEATLTALGADAAQRARVFARVDAPRALRPLRQSAAAASGLDAPPSAGSLLRALRLRQHITQQEAARRVGANRSSIARWERGDRLPDTAQMQALCYALGAREEELVALTTKRFREGPDPQRAAATWEEAETDLRARLEALSASSADVLSAHNGVKDLAFLLLQQEAWEWALRVAAARPLLARAYAYDAHSRSFEARWDESGALARQALRLAGGGHTSEQQSVALRAVICQAASLAHGGEQQRPAPGHAVRLLRTWLPRCPSLPEYASWMLANMARYTRMSGNVAEALCLSEQACWIAQRCSNWHEAYLRRGDSANLLLEAGRPAEALRVAPEPLPDRNASPNQAEVLLLLARAHRQAGNRSEAHDWLARAVRLINTHHLERVRPQAEALAQQF